MSEDGEKTSRSADWRIVETRSLQPRDDCCCCCEIHINESEEAAPKRKGTAHDAVDVVADGDDKEAFI